MTLDPGRSPRSPRPWTLARQYSLASLLVLLASLLVLGWWVGRQIEVGVTHRAAAAAALFVENYIVTPLQGLPARPWLTGAEKAELRARFEALKARHRPSDLSALEAALDALGVGPRR